MKSKLIFILFLPLCFACNSPTKHFADHKVDSTKKSKTAQNSEYLDWDKTTVNGTIPMISSFKEVVKQLGKPDKIDTLTDGDNGSYFNKKFRYCYFKAPTFEKYNDTLVFSSIDFSKPTKFYLTDSINRFDNSFKDIDFKKHFPYSFENNQLHGTDMDKYEYISLPTTKKKTNDEWDFTFHTNTGKLWTLYHDDPYINNK